MRMSTAPSERRVRPWILTGLLVLVLLISGFSALAAWRNSWALQSAMTEAASEGPWTIEELEAARPDLADNQNAAVQLLAVRALMPADWGSFHRAGDRNLAGYQAELRTALMDYLIALPANARLDDVPMKMIHAEVQRAGDAVARARELIRYRQGRLPLTVTADYVSTRWPQVHEVRTIGSLLKYDAFVRGQIERDTDGALESCRAALAAARSIGNEEFFVSQMMRLNVGTSAAQAMHWALGQGSGSEPVLARLQQDLEAEEAEPLGLYGMLGERAGFDRFIQWLEDSQLSYSAFRNALLLKGQGPSSYKVGPVAMELEVANIYGSPKGARAAMLRYMNELVALARLPIEEQTAAIKAFEERWKNRPVLVALLGGAETKLLRYFRSYKTTLRAAITLIAIERYRLANGRWPEQLDELTPVYLRGALLDPFDGKPLRYARLDSAITVYSVGENGIDEGGAVVWTETTRPVDIGMRLYEPCARGKLPWPFKPPPQEPKANSGQGDANGKKEPKQP